MFSNFKWSALFSKVKAAVIAAAVIGVAMLLDNLAGLDYTDELGPVAPFLSAVIVAVAAWWKREHKSPTG